jgi:hypothetical protein
MNTRVAALFFAALFACHASADVMVMKNGSRIVGSLISADSGVFKFDTPWGGTLEIKAANVESMETDSSTNIVMMEDGQVFRDKRITATEHTLTIHRNGEGSGSYAIEEIKLVNPDPWLLGEGYDFTGRSSLAFEAERGNSDTDEWDFDYNFTLRSLKDRYAFRGRAEFDEASGAKVNENWALRNKYDRFMGGDPDNYWGGKLRLEYNKFANLDLRTLVGPHLGREFFDQPLIRLRGEFGLVYVDEQFDAAEDNDFYGALVEIEAESDVIGFGTTLYLFHDTTLNFDSATDPLSNTTVGLRMPLIFGFETALEARYEYNGSAPDDAETTDEMYTFRVGYTW